MIYSGENKVLSSLIIAKTTLDFGGWGVLPCMAYLFLANLPSGNAKLTAKHIFKCLEKRKGEDGKK